MPITSLLDLHIKPELIASAPDLIDDILVATRAFDGNLGVEVLTDVEDPGHVVLVEHWASLEADDAYRAWRASEGESPLAPLLTGSRTLTRYRD